MGQIQLSRRALGKYSAWIAGTILLISSFQNCAPMQGVGPSSDQASTTTGGGGGGTTTNPPPPPPSALQTACQSAGYSAPAWSVGGTGTTSGAVSLGYAINNPMPASSGTNVPSSQLTYSAGSVASATGTQPNCTSKNVSTGNITVNCKMTGGTLSVSVNPGNGAECGSGTATFDLVLDDGCKSSGFNSAAPPSKAFSVTLNSSCQAEADLAASAPQASSQFGSRTAISGNTAVFTSPGYYAVTSSFPTGAAYISANSGGTWSAPAMIPNVFAAGATATGVALNGGLLVVGAPGSIGSSAAGAAYVFSVSGTTATLLQTLTPPSGAASPNGTLMYFGYSVAIVGSNTIAIGAFQANSQTGSGAGESGQVYIYTTGNGSTWSYSQTLEPNDPVNYLNFGTSLASSGNYLVVGAPMNTARETTPGNVYVFNNSSGSFGAPTEIKGVNAVSGGSKSQLQFGVSVDTNGSQVAVGATAYDQSGETASGTTVYTGHFGAAFIYNMDGSANTSYGGSNVLTEAAKITNNGAGGVNFFMGSAVKFSGTNLYVGESGYPTTTGNQGAILKYVSGQSGVQYRLVPMSANRQNSEEFGVNISVSGMNLAAGAPGRASSGATNAGMGFVFAAP